MPDPLDYRDREMKDAPAARPRARSAIVIGVTIFLVSVLVALLPLVPGFGGQLAKYIVAPAFIAGCVGLSITANATIDWWRGK